MQKIGGEFRHIVDQHGLGAGCHCDLGESDGIGAVLASDHQYELAFRRQLPDRPLPVRRRVADVFAGWAVDFRVGVLERMNDLVGIIQAQSCLCEIDDLGGIFDPEILDAIDGFENLNRIGRFSIGPDDFLVILVADQDDLPATFRVADGLCVHLGDQWAGGVNGGEVPAAGFIADLRAHAMGTEDHDRAAWHLIDGFDECDATVLESLYDVLVVNNLVEHVDRFTLDHVEKLIDHVDGHVDASAEAAGVCQDDFHEPVVLVVFHDSSPICRYSVSSYRLRAPLRSNMSVTSIIDRLEAWGPGTLPGLDSAQSMAYCRKLALGHYENFSVLSRMVPESMRNGASVVYAFCRWADDLSDEIQSSEQSLELLAWWRAETLACFEDGKAAHPVFVALASQIDRYRLRPEPFLDLIDAFEQDQRMSRYSTWDSLIDYCRRSADPVGRLVLRLAEQDHDPVSLKRSDAICTALQLTNHWQDARRDLKERDRIYIPSECHDIADLETRMKHTIEIGHAPDQTFLEEWRVMMKGLVERTWPGFEQTDQLLDTLPAENRPMIWLFAAGGSQVLRRIMQVNYETILFRPKLGKLAKISLLLSARRAARRRSS